MEELELQDAQNVAFAALEKHATTGILTPAQCVPPAPHRDPRRRCSCRRDVAFVADVPLAPLRCRRPTARPPPL
jgi:hypothetical protein